MFVELASGWNVTSKNISKKNAIFFGHLYKSQKLWQVCPVITHWTYACLCPWALLNLLRNFSAWVWRKKLGRGGGYLIPKMMRNFFLLCFSHFPTKMEEDDTNPNTLRNFSSYKKGLKKVPWRVPKIQGKGQGRLEKSKQKQIFSQDRFPNLPLYKVTKTKKNHLLAIVGNNCLLDR